MIKLFARAAALLFLLTVPVSAQDETPSDTQPQLAEAVESAAGASLIVATREAPPFALRGPDGEWTGIAIEMWEALADELDLAYDLRETTLADMIEGTAEGQYAASVAALSITADREFRVDFTYPYYSTGLGIAINPISTGGWLQVARNFFSWQFMVVLAGLSAVLLTAGVAIWFFERKGNEEEFSRKPVKGLGDGFWWAAVTMTTVGYGDKSPRTIGGRIVGLIWMFTAMIIVASFTAAIAASLTVGQLGSGIEGASDLDSVRVGVVESSTGAEELARRRIDARGFESVAEGYEALLEARLDAFVHDRPVLSYVARDQFDGQVRVLDQDIGREQYGIALPEGSDLREPLNRALLSYINSPRYEELIRRYLGSDGG
ncbi:transporter substrate-binding domain-containing protein [Palleronia abyssalis]|uniref:Glutamine-binding periplasmic protein n=1 Tax=Palleronia abyssalis TaxID=1501240 RepID=A0A2R8BT99_9RHOB|nr:transporter substrate-binding domain-containing protein [Palleronia abyssalis]SPJ23355.1 Glutamine-binding periplasmic protein [Palleronia abyssalis]